MERFDCNYRSTIALIGNPRVGKLALARRFANGKYAETECTIGTELVCKQIKIGGQSVPLELWVLAGQECFRQIFRAYISRVDWVLLSYDCSDEKSFNDINFWLAEADKHSRRDTTMVLVGNKCDQHDKIVSTERGEALAKSLGIAFFETSAKENINIDKLFYYLAEEACRKLSLKAHSAGVPIKLSNIPKRKKTCA